MCPIAFDATPAKSVVGIDVGSTASKAVVFSEHGILAWAIVASGGDYQMAAGEALDQALAKAGLAWGRIAYVVATGYGAACVSRANQSVSDITCQGRGIAYLFPSVRTVVDIGGQFSRVFQVDKKGRVVNFVLSEKCAAGSGQLLQVIARILQVEIGELGGLSLKSKKRVDFTTGCAVFIESEVISRIAEGFSREDIIAGIHGALATKIQGLVERVGFEPDYALIGGGAKNVGLVREIEQSLETKVLVPEEPQIVAALGAALMAEEKTMIRENPH
jgi:predicted CoA-substrate-specific enzyme activase